MSQEFVTREELLSTLVPFAKSSEVDSKLRETDSATRLVMDRTLTVAQQALQTKILTDLNSVKSDISQIIAAQIPTLRESVSVDIEHRLSALKGLITEQVLAQALELVSKKSSEAYTEYHSDQSKIKDQVELVVKAHEERANEKVSASLAHLEVCAKEIAEKTSAAHVQSLQTSIVGTVEGALAAISKTQTRAFQEFKAILETELSKKVIDKMQIEKKIQEIEGELQSKIKGVIEFQIDQARAMMEQSAKSEMREGIQASLMTLMSR